jgi:isopropylmalate/homocitrate/citramalate synthase
MRQVLIFDTTLRAGEQSPGQSPGARLTRATEDGIERAGRQPELHHD